MRIVVGLDGSAASLPAHGLVSSVSWPGGTQFLFVHASEGATDWTAMIPGGAWFSDGQSSRSLNELAVLDELAQPLRQRGHPVEIRLEGGPAGQVLRDAAAEFVADLIVVGSRGRGPAASAFLGSVSADLVDHAPCPVLVARAPTVSKILLATDGSDNARAIPFILGRWRAFRGLPIEVLSVAPSPAASTELMVTPWMTPAVNPVPERQAGEQTARHHGFVEELSESLREAGWKATGHVRIGDPADEIVAEARAADCDLIVTGSRGMGDLRRLLTGSVAHDVLLHSRCSVLVMRGHVPARLEERAAVRSVGTALA
ncbi:MAG TPA: universal stress protein [Candidatus Limnocylindria bacterium]|nr:universal stress protein [Candidatus Limnocylindria bacterium]